MAHSVRLQVWGLGHQSPQNNTGLQRAACSCCFVTQPCLTLCDPVDCSPPGSSVLEISQAKYWSGLPYPPPGGYARLRDRTWVSCTACLFFTILKWLPPKSILTFRGNSGSLEKVQPKDLMKLWRSDPEQVANDHLCLYGSFKKRRDRT